MERWKESLQEASFKGIKFFVSNHSLSTGKRNIAHQYPGSDRTENEDLGRKTNEFSVSVYIVGEDYFYLRDKILKVSQSKNNAGTLVHPYLGNIYCRLVEANLDENITEGRMCRFLLTFIEEPETVLTYTESSLKEQMYETAEKAKNDLQLFIERVFDINSAGLSKAQEVISTLDGISNSILSLKSSLAPFGQWRKSLDTAIGKLYAIAYSSIALGQYLRYILTTGSDVKDKVIVFSVDDQRKFFSETSIINSSLIGTIDSTNWAEDPVQVLTATSLMFSVISSSAILGEYEFSSIDEAENLRNDTYRYINFIMQLDGLDEDIYVNFYDLRGLIEAIIEEKLPELGRARIYTVNSTGINSLRLSQEIYSSLSEEEKVLSLNSENINPWFLTGDIKVVR